MLRADTRRAVETALQRQDFDAAGRVAETAIERGERHAMLFLFAGMRRQIGGDARGGMTLLREAVALDPANADILAATGDALRVAGSLVEALRIYDRALAADPSHIAAWYGRARALDANGQTEAALDGYTRVAALAPGTAPGHAGMATVLARLGRSAEARSAAARGLAIDAADATSMIALALCDIADGDSDTAIARLEALANRIDLRPDDRIAALTLLGDALDSRGDTDAAFGAYASAKARFAEANAGPDAPPHHRLLAEAIEATVRTAPPQAFAAATMVPDAQAQRHVFLLGYPRSGTTLVEQILATSPCVTTLEEEPTLAAGVDQFFNLSGLRGLLDLDPDHALGLRQAYWQAVRDAGIEPEGRIFIDMDPAKTLQLPLISRLFPGARVVIVRRDPRDVVWSCFRRSFVFNQMSHEFSSLQRAARHYDAVMRLSETCLGRLPLNVHVLRYDDLVRDFDAVTRRLCRFIDLPWSDAMRRFDSSAKGRPIKTRSADQVRLGLFNGSGQWRRYGQFMAPVLPLLEPWVDRFGFDH